MSKYKIGDQNSLYFVTYTIIQWVDILTRPIYKDIIIDSLKYCQKNKGLIIYAYVIMTNHVHLIIRAEESYRLSDILRDHKRHNSKAILKELMENPLESRKSWILWLLKSAGLSNSNNREFQLWQQDNHPVELSTNRMIDQRLDYIHQNPVRQAWVSEPEDYEYSSAVSYCGKIGKIPVTLI